MTDKLEITQEDREAAAWALDPCPDTMTWEKLTAAHRTPDQIWRANRVAQAFARHRLQERERCAKVAEGFSRTMHSPKHTDTGKLVATAIRQPKEPSNG